MREVLGGFVGGQVQIGENDDSGDGMLQDLRPPAGMGPGVKPLAQLESQPSEHPDDTGEKPSRTAKGVMIVVRPTQTEAILARLLNCAARVARLPVVALGLEDQVARQIDRARQLDHPLESRLGRVEAL